MVICAIGKPLPIDGSGLRIVIVRDSSLPSLWVDW